jgi:hypothetical protein
VYGDTNTGAQFMQSIVKNFAPAIDAINTGLKGKIQDLFTSDKPSLPSTDNKEDAEFEPVK